MTTWFLTPVGFVLIWTFFSWRRSVCCDRICFWKALRSLLLIFLPWAPMEDAIFPESSRRKLRLVCHFIQWNYPKLISVRDTLPILSTKSIWEQLFPKHKSSVLVRSPKIKVARTRASNINIGKYIPRSNQFSIGMSNNVSTLFFGLSMCQPNHWSKRMEFTAIFVTRGA